MTAPARRRTRIAGVAVAALAGGLALQPVMATPAQAGVGCDQPQPPVLGDVLNDCVAPESKIIGKPPFETTSTQASFLVTTEQSDPDGKDVTFECRLLRGFTLESAVVEKDWADCSATDEADSTPLGRVTYTGLTPDDYLFYFFQARASDVPDPLADPFALLLGLENKPNTEATPTSYEWTVLPDGGGDGILPETRITSKPTRWHPYSYAAVGYASDQDAQRFECTLDGRPHEDCGREQANIRGLGPGDHTFEVRAIDYAGQPDERPATTTWTVPQGVLSIKSMRKGWKKVRDADHYRELYAIATKKGAGFSRAVNGARSVALVVTTCPDCGTLKVTTNKGRLVKTVQLRAKKTRTRKVIELGSWKKPRSGSFRFEVVSDGKDVIVEGIAQSTWR